MRVYDIIAKKRDAKRLSKQEIDFLVQNYVQGEIPDYQMSAFLMASYINGLDRRELAALTDAMIRSGETLDLDQIPGIKADKHSTGGIGDKTTLVLAPLVACLGVPIAKMSGRGLGLTGGTLDKLESIPGFTVDLSPKKFIHQVKEIGVAIASASERVVPADHKLYALRDVTATISSIPLIAASVVSKKVAGGAQVVVFDVKCGSGAFLKTVVAARELAYAMFDMMERMGRSPAAIISDMDQPLGFAVGNSLEVAEAIKTLKGEGPQDLKDLCILLGAYMLILAKKASGVEEAKEQLEHALVDGRALAKLEQLIKAQGGDSSCLDFPKALPQADFSDDLHAESSGYITAIDAATIGRVSFGLGAGRYTKESEIDLSAGVVLKAKVGSKVTEGDVLVEMFSSKIADFGQSKSWLREAIKIGNTKIKAAALIHDVII